MTWTSPTCLPAFSHPCISHCLGDLLSLSPPPLYPLPPRLWQTPHLSSLSYSYQGHWWPLCCQTQWSLLCLPLMQLWPHSTQLTIPIFLKLFSRLLWYPPPPLSLTTPSQSLHSFLYSFMCSFNKHLLRTYYLLSPMLGTRQSTEQSPAPRSLYSGQLSFIDSPLLLNLQMLAMCVCINWSGMSDSLWPLDYSLPPGSSVHGISQARVLEWVAVAFSRGSSQPRDRTRVSCIVGRFFTIWTTRDLLSFPSYPVLWL